MQSSTEQRASLLLVRVKYCMKPSWTKVQSAMMMMMVMKVTQYSVSKHTQRNTSQLHFKHKHESTRLQEMVSRVGVKGTNAAQRQLLRLL
jgi:uncharacterized protein YqgV (UPF0045/DUF77 family)